MQKNKKIDRILLVAPYKGNIGISDMFIAPNLGLYRIKFYIENMFPAVKVDVIDPNISEVDFRRGSYGAIGFSLTHTTLEHDLGLIFRAKAESPDSLVMAGGIEATFSHENLLDISPVDCVVLGEGEEVVADIVRSFDGASVSAGIQGIPGVACRNESGGHAGVSFGRALDKDKFSYVSSLIDFSKIPYELFWKANAAQYTEPDPQVINTVRVFTSNYCPHNCTFCSSTNFLDYAYNGAFSGKKKTGVVALGSDEIMSMIIRIFDARRDVKTIIFDDDNFVISPDRLNRLSRMIIEAKRSGRISADMTFICQARTDSFRSSEARAALSLLREAGFRMIMFGVESFASGVLAEFGKKTDMASVDTVLRATNDSGMKALIYLILFSPMSTIDDVSNTVTRSLEYMSLGMEVSLNFYIMDIPGSRYAGDESLVREYRDVPVVSSGAEVSRIRKSEFIYPKDPSVREFARGIEAGYARYEDYFKNEFGIRHVPGRIYSFVVFYAILDTLKRESDKSRLIDIFRSIHNTKS